MEFRILKLELRKIDNKSCLYDLENNMYDFEKIPDNYDILCLVTDDRYDLRHVPLRISNYEFIYQKLNAQIFHNTKLITYKFGSIGTDYLDLGLKLEMFVLLIYRDDTVGAHYMFGESLNDDLLNPIIDKMNDSLPMIVISRDNYDLMQNKFLCSLFNITEININYEKNSCYLIEKRKIMIKAAIKKY
ncbi:hypothetical protein Hokovirus_1_254 [Hokovirus HKV1]|uniref:Uncharacterized protein n=1 Tax=Hokovirus HKV1 TaxID=1977638 RepID=A0A1V0SF82_9VIRU|nr:hypothetical protein Hokovirus_1_254 [Hokovirus HKV1]